MTTKKELRQRLDLHIDEITKIYTQLDETRANVKQLQQKAELHAQHIEDWRILFEQIQTAVANIREVAETAVTREAARQNKIASVAAEVTGRLHNIAECFRAQSAADKREFSQINARLDNLEKKTNHDQQRRPTAETTTPTTTTTAPKKAKLPTNPRAERPAARNRNRPPARTNPS